MTSDGEHLREKNYCKGEKPQGPSHILMEQKLRILKLGRPIHSDGLLKERKGSGLFR